MRRIIVVVGRVCSGKTSYMNRYPDYWNKIDVGDIVRKLTKETSRRHDPTLDQDIMSELSFMLKDCKDAVIVGIRQKSILEYLQKNFRSFSHLSFVLLVVPEQVLKNRFNQRADKKDSKVTFEEAIERDNLLGLQDAIDYVCDQKNNTVLDYYSREEFKQKQNEILRHSTSSELESNVNG